MTFKRFLVLMVALGAAMAWPESRAVIMDVTDPALNPIRAQWSKHEMRKVARELLAFEVTYRNLPGSQSAFERWMSQRIHEADGRSDSWGAPYMLRVTADSFFVRSHGRDGAVGGGDDLRVGERRDDPWR